MYNVPHHACHPSRMGAPSNNSGCGCFTLVILIICIAGLLGQCGTKDNTYNNDTNYNFPTGRTDNTTNSYITYATSSDATFNNTINDSNNYNSTVDDISSTYVYHNDKTEHVNGYYRKDGTYVHSYNRRPRS